jgi:hypothetical protein
MATELFNGFLRLGKFPLDGSSVFQSFADAYNYAATNETAYAGQIVVVVDQTAQTVSVYTLTFPSEGFEGNFELIGVSNNGDGANIRTINSKSPDSEGIITLYGTDIRISETDARLLSTVLSAIESISGEGETIQFSKPIVVSRITGLVTGQIQNLTDAVNLQYLQTSINTAIIGVTKTVKAVLNSNGRAFDDQYLDFPVGSIIRKVRLDIIQPYDTSTNITLSIGGLVIMEPNDIFETEVGSYIVESNKIVTTSGPLIASLGSFSTGGSAIVLIDYTENPYDNN